MLADTEEVALSFEQTNFGSQHNLLQTNRIRFVNWQEKFKKWHDSL